LANSTYQENAALAQWGRAQAAINKVAKTSIRVRLRQVQAGIFGDIDAVRGNVGHCHSPLRSVQRCHGFRGSLGTTS
jgi:putative component of toxin-antitoxin plasmid stabilization module